MLRRDLREQRYIRGGCTWFAATPKHLSTISLPLFAEGIGNTNTIGLSIVDYIDAFVVLCLIEVVGACRTLVAVGGGNTEVGDLARGTQGRYHIICTTASNISTFLRKAGVRVGRANLSKRCLIRNRHLCLRHITVKRSDNSSNESITDQRSHVLCANRRIMDTTGAYIVFRIE